MEGYLEKKSGGKEGRTKIKVLEKWDKRFFVLPKGDGSELHYFKKADDYRDGKTPLGSLECRGATVFLKEVKGQTFRFTVPARLHCFVQDTICVRQYSVY